MYLFSVQFIPTCEIATEGRYFAIEFAYCFIRHLQWTTLESENSQCYDRIQLINKLLGTETIVL